MADINFNTVPLTSSLSVNDTAHITNTGNAHQRLQIQKLIDLAKNGALTEFQSKTLDEITSGCWIVHYNSAYNRTMLSRPSEWTGGQEAGKVADGVLVVEGGHHIVVAPTGGRALWGSTSSLVAGAGNYSSDRVWAVSDFGGKDKTKDIVQSPAYSGDGASYAPGFCAAYSTNGIAAGKWWLPSIGELIMISANMEKINVCLQLINGATIIPLSEAHWSSTESDANAAWGYYFRDHGFYPNAPKTMYSFYVRPVTEFA